MKNLKTIALALGLISMTAFTSCSKDNTDTPEVIAPATPTGTGAKATPYNVTAAIANQAVATVWVKGYIVGCIKTGTPNVNQFDGPFTGVTGATTNLFIADNAKERDASKCLIVQLPTGAVRDALNLDANAANLGKEVLLCGTAGAYFKLPGLNNAVACSLAGGALIGVDPASVPAVPTLPVAGAIKEEAFAGALGSFTNETVTGSTTSQWMAFTGTPKCVKASGYVSTTKLNEVSESYLVSPEIDLTGKTAATLNFGHCINYLKITDATAAAARAKYCKVLVSADYKTTAATTTWTELSGINYPTIDSFTMVGSKEISLANYANKKIRIAFKYTSDATTACTWEIQNFVVK